MAGAVIGSGNISKENERGSGGKESGGPSFGGSEKISVVGVERKGHTEAGGWKSRQGSHTRVSGFCSSS